MKKSVLILYIFSIFLFLSCNQAKEVDQVNDPDLPSETEMATGYALVESNCFSCHSPDANFENRIAPPMAAVKQHYIHKESTEETFTDDLISFLNNPSVETSKMPQAVERFNLMPKMSITEDQLKSIATYIFHTKLEQPGWFKKHFRNERKKYKAANVQLTPSERGQKLAMQTKAVLGRNLLGAINSKGTEHALEFCSTKATHLTDSMSILLGASIKRVSDKNRNPNNIANAAELEYINKTKASIGANQKPVPQLTEAGDKIVGYYPIMTSKMCLQCHGKRESEIMPNTLEKINALYPNDLASGYGENELRGIWVVEMDK